MTRGIKSGVERIFGGQDFTFDSWHPRKSRANARAKRLRELGYKARVTAGRNHYKLGRGEMGYIVWARGRRK